ncbi:Bifunctional coenzyme A synthase [Trichuris trichiura]|uniref:Bifunctional coenzyme A synthase n=1 Tax=Trichuris trichiura TaxID=36087 RepID=A0A077ZDK3_TRITR|nr:Bifunctional coenzyme A synthase [Trichuris trichiura]
MKVLLYLTQLQSTVRPRLEALLSRIASPASCTVYLQVHSDVAKQWNLGRAFQFVRDVYEIVGSSNFKSNFRILTDSLKGMSDSGWMGNVDSLIVDCDPNEFSERFLPADQSASLPPWVTYVKPASLISQFSNLRVTEAKPALDTSWARQEVGLFRHAAIGGTFDHLHVGHEMLLTCAALAASKLTIGVSYGELLYGKFLFGLVEPLDLRVCNINHFLSTIAPDLSFTCVPIADLYGPTLHDETMDCLIVSEETFEGGQMINLKRADKGMTRLELLTIDLLNIGSEVDGQVKISSTLKRVEMLGRLFKIPKSRPTSNPYIIGLTGGIASGKSKICEYLKSWGAHVINCDALGHKAYQPYTTVYNDILSAFDEDIVDADTGQINRQALGAIVFKDENKRQILNRIVWPRIAEMVVEEIRRVGQNNRIVVVEAAVLLEAGWESLVHEVWLTYVPEGEAVKRVMDRTKCTQKEALRRVHASRFSNEDNFGCANVVFCSLWEPETTRAQVDCFKSAQRIFDATFL